MVLRSNLYHFISIPKFHPMLSCYYKLYSHNRTRFFFSPLVSYLFILIYVSFFFIFIFFLYNFLFCRFILFMVTVSQLSYIVKKSCDSFIY